MKGGTYTKTVAKIQVRGIFRIRDIRRNVLPKFIEICMETLCWCSPILGDPGADKEGERKSKRAKKYIWNKEK